MTQPDQCFMRFILIAILGGSARDLHRRATEKKEREIRKEKRDTNAA